MPAAAQNLANADAILKDLYRGPIIEQINQKTYMLDMIERDSESVDFTGRRAIFPVHVGRNLSTASITDGGTLPIPGQQVYDDGQVAIKYHAAGMSITDQAVKQAKNGEGAFVNLLDNDSKLLAKDMKKSINRQIFGDGKGTLALLTTAPAGATTFTVDSVQYLTSQSTPLVGQYIDIITPSNGTVKAAGVLITGINRTTRVITVGTAVTAAVGDGVYVAGSFGLEMEAGLRNVTGSSRTLHGINSATAGNEFWNGNQINAAGAVAGESLFEQLADTIGGVGQGEVDVFLTSRGIRRRLADTYQSTKRFNDAKAVEIHGGYTAIFVNETPVVADDDVPKGFAFALRKEGWKWFQVDDPDWLTSADGTIWQMGTSTTASQRRATWEAWMVWYAALANMAPNQTGAIINAADDVAA